MSQNQNSIFKQILGAGSGMAIALGIYGVYTLVAPPVKAYLASVALEQPEEASKFTEGERKERRQEIAARAREIIEQELR